MLFEKGYFEWFYDGCWYTLKREDYVSYNGNILYIFKIGSMDKYVLIKNGIKIDISNSYYIFSFILIYLSILNQWTIFHIFSTKPINFYNIFLAGNNALKLNLIFYLTFDFSTKI